MSGTPARTTSTPDLPDRGDAVAPPVGPPPLPEDANRAVPPPVSDTESPKPPPVPDGLSAKPPDDVALETAGTAVRRWFSRGIKHRLSGFTVSLLAHVVLLTAMATLFHLATTRRDRPNVLSLATADLYEPPDDSPDLAPLSEPAAGAVFEMDVRDRTASVIVPDVRMPLADRVSPSPLANPIIGWGPVDPNEWLREHRTPIGGGFEGRSAEARGNLLKRGGPDGPTGASERAVAEALVWLAAHQRSDGSWRFTHQNGICEGRCGNPGTEDSTTGATAIALLPFLGAGCSQTEGEYREVVERGIYYLAGRMKRTAHGGDLMEGTMYSHGLASIALCEAYGMTQDEALRDPAQAALDFICHAQHPRGGWRYFPGQPGDMTVFGWQFMALKSGRMAGLDVPSPTVDAARKFLDTKQTLDGAYYGYIKPGKLPVPTAVGLLSRMYLGWPQEEPRLEKGVEYLSRLGPSTSDMYFNYYATQVLHHYEGPRWTRWNARMRDFLVDSQDRRGHQAGSWFFEDQHGSVGGRLYTTAVCAMILEVYYRHMPLYERRTVDDAL